jgi:hypothetical protein
MDATNLPAMEAQEQERRCEGGRGIRCALLDGRAASRHHRGGGEGVTVPQPRLATVAKISAHPFLCRSPAARRALVQWPGSSMRPPSLLWLPPPLLLAGAQDPAAAAGHTGELRCRSHGRPRVGAPSSGASIRAGVETLSRAWGWIRGELLRQ